MIKKIIIKTVNTYKEQRECRIMELSSRATKIQATRKLIDGDYSQMKENDVAKITLKDIQIRRKRPVQFPLGPPQLNSLHSEKIFNTIRQMKKDRFAETPIKETDRRLRIIAKAVNLDKPEEVREYLAMKSGKNSYIEGLVNSYD